MNGRRGFTLIETVIAIMLLSFISLFTVQSIQRALQTKAKMQGSIDRNATLRDALKVMERDVNMAFNYRDIGIELYNQAQDERKKAASTNQNQQGGAGQRDANGNVIPNRNNQQFGAVTPVAGVDSERFKHKTEKIVTHFIGEAESMSFTSLSNVRMTENSPICSQAEIGYNLRGCRRRSTQEQSSKCLWRRVSNYIHDDITREGDETVLLENVSEFKLRYLGPGKEREWIDTWITNERGDGTTKGKFPYAVEITIEVQDSAGAGKGKKLRMTAVASIRNPNNPKPLNPDGTPADGSGVGSVVDPNGQSNGQNGQNGQSNGGQGQSNGGGNGSTGGAAGGGQSGGGR